MTLCSQTLPDAPWLPRTARIVSITPEYEGVATYRLVEDPAPMAQPYHFIPGQFNMLYLPGIGESAISMSGDADDPREWVHTIREAGNVTRSLAALRPGQTLGLRGPFGAGWPIEHLKGHDVVIVAGGLGMAPLRPALYSLRNHRDAFGSVSLILGARTAEGLLYPNEYEDWRQHRIDVQLTVDRPTPGWHGNLGVVTTLLDRLPLTTPASTHVLTCGPEVMMKYVALAALRRGIPERQVWVSMERNMQCAAGLCGHCQLGPAFVCKDGPVMRYDLLRPYLFVEGL